MKTIESVYAFIFRVGGQLRRLLANVSALFFECKHLQSNLFISLEMNAGQAGLLHYQN